MARPIILIPHLFWLVGMINFSNDYSPPSSHHLDPTIVRLSSPQQSSPQCKPRIAKSIDTPRPLSSPPPVSPTPSSVSPPQRRQWQHPGEGRRWCCGATRRCSDARSCSTSQAIAYSRGWTLASSPGPPPSLSAAMTGASGSFLTKEPLKKAKDTAPSILR